MKKSGVTSTKNVNGISATSVKKPLRPGQSFVIYFDKPYFSKTLPVDAKFVKLYSFSLKTVITSQEINKCVFVTESNLRGCNFVLPQNKGKYKLYLVDAKGNILLKSVDIIIK
jgi:hypothetical protein